MNLLSFIVTNLNPPKNLIRWLYMTEFFIIINMDEEIRENLKFSGKIW